MATHTTVTVQLLQATTFNHPPGDLCDGERGDYIRVVVPLYRALAEGDLESAKAILQDHEYLVRYSITENKETPLHVVVMSQRTELVRYLVNMMSKADLELQNRDGNTGFCLAAVSGNVEMAKIMVKKNPALPIIYGTENTMPLYLAVCHEKHEMVAFLYNQSDRMQGDGWTRERRNKVLVKCIQANMLDVAIQILKDNEELPHDKQHVWDVLQLLAQKPEAFNETKSLTRWALTTFVTRPTLTERNAILLLRLLLERVTEKLKYNIHGIVRGSMIKIDEMETYPFQVLFIAAKMNNKQFLAELICKYPDLVWQRNDDGQTIFHIAAAHGHRDVFRLLYNIGPIKDFITPIVDKEGNNILHMVGNTHKEIVYEDSKATPYEIFREYFWYQEVERTLPPPCRQAENKAGNTPEKVFIENQKKAVSDGMNWIYETINQSMVVAAVVCTIGFSLVYSLPGGFDQNSGFPIFRRSKMFIWFIIVKAVCFIMSITSISIFICLIFSRHEERKEVLLRRWLIGQQALGVALSAILIAFISSLFLLYPNSILPYIILASAIALSLLVAIEHKSYMMDSTYIIYMTWFFFNPKKQKINHQNPWSQCFCYC